MTYQSRVTNWDDPRALFHLITWDKDRLATRYGHRPNYYKVHRHRKKRQLDAEGIKVDEILRQPDGEAELIKRLENRGRKLGQAAVAGLVQLEVPEEHLSHHLKLQEALSQGTVRRLTVTSREGSHQGFIKNSEQEIEYTEALPNRREEVRFSIELDHEPQWPPVVRVESQKLPKREAKKALESQKTAVILPDLQIPFHSEEALDIALQVIADTKPDKIIFLGDTLDLSAWGKYEQRPEFAVATQEAVNRLHSLLAGLRKAHRAADIVVLAGNHEQRMATSLLRNAQAAYGLKRADQPDGWPVMSVPYLCAFDQLSVEYVDGYPANRYWINERLQVRHGNIARPGGKTAVAIANDEKVSTIFGHIHRIENQYKTVNIYNGGRTSAAFGIGALCRIDGHVPSTKSGIDQKTMRPVENYENWQNGFCVVNYWEGDAPFYIQQAYINTFQGYETYFNGKVYRPLVG